MAFAVDITLALIVMLPICANLSFSYVKSTISFTLYIKLYGKHFNVYLILVQINHMRPLFPPRG